MCLDLDGYPDPQLEVWMQFHEAARLLLDRDDGMDFPAFLATRHVLELGLKRILTVEGIGLPDDKPHSLHRLLDLVPRQHEVHRPQYEVLRHRIREYHDADPRGDAARYHASRSGMPSFAGMCCTERDEALEALDWMSELV